MTQVILRQYDRPKESNMTNDIEWFCKSFGLSSGRDTAYTSNMIVTNILTRAADKKIISSETIAENLESSQNLINHHLRNLINSGLIIRKRKQILIRGGSLKEAVREIKRDALRILDTIEIIAGEIDSELGFQNR